MHTLLAGGLARLSLQPALTPRNVAHSHSMRDPPVFVAGSAVVAKIAHEFTYLVTLCHQLRRWAHSTPQQTSTPSASTPSWSIFTPERSDQWTTRSFFSTTRFGVERSLQIIYSTFPSCLWSGARNPQNSLNVMRTKVNVMGLRISVIPGLHVSI